MVTRTLLNGTLYVQCLPCLRSVQGLYDTVLGLNGLLTMKWIVGLQNFLVNF